MAGTGSGRALAERFAREGARVVVADVDVARAEKIAARIDGLAVHCDVSDQSAVADLVAQAVDAYGPVHVFCSNAGIGDPGPGLASTVDQVERIVGVNLLAHVWAAQAVVPTMVEEGEGYLVQTISSATLITGPSGMGYTLTKHGALGFAEWIAFELRAPRRARDVSVPQHGEHGMLGRDEDAEEAASETSPGNTSGMPLGDVIEPELCADMTIDALRNGHFLVLPHPRVGESFLRKAATTTGGSRARTVVCGACAARTCSPEDV